MNDTRVPEEKPRMQYADPEGRPSPMTEAFVRLLRDAPRGDLTAVRNAVEARLEATHRSWCHEHMTEQDMCASDTVDFGNDKGYAFLVEDRDLGGVEVSVNWAGGGFNLSVGNAEALAQGLRDLIVLARQADAP